MKPAMHYLSKIEAFEAKGPFREVEGAVKLQEGDQFLCQCCGSPRVALLYPVVSDKGGAYWIGADCLKALARRGTVKTLIPATTARDLAPGVLKQFVENWTKEAQQ